MPALENRPSGTGRRNRIGVERMPLSTGHPSRPVKLHRLFVRAALVSGKVFDVTIPGVTFMLQNAVMILKPWSGDGDPGYDIIAFRNIERLERFEKRE